MSKIYTQPIFILDGRLIESYEDFQDFCLDLELKHDFEFSLVAANQEDLQLFKVCKIDSSCLEMWMHEIEPLDSLEKAALFYLIDTCQFNTKMALEKMGDISIQEGTLLEVATAMFDEIYLHELPEAVQSYVDYEQFAYDARVGGDMYEFTFNGKTYTCTNSNSR